MAPAAGVGADAGRRVGSSGVNRIPESRADAEGQRAPYQVYVPADYSPAKAWPVIVFLQGSGKSGSDGLVPIFPSSDAPRRGAVETGVDAQAGDCQATFLAGTRQNMRRVLFMPHPVNAPNAEGEKPAV